MKLDNLVSLVNQTKAGNTGRAIMIDRQGRYLSHQDQTKILSGNLKDLKGMERVAEAMTAGRKGVMQCTPGGIDSYSGYAPLKMMDWSVAVIQDVNELMAAAYAIREFIMIFAGICLLVAVALIVFFAGRTIKPIIDAVDLARHIQQGDLSKRINLKRKDEIGTLAVTLDRMADGLQEKAELAQKIAEGNLNSQVKVTSENDILGHSLRKMTQTLNHIMSMIRDTSSQLALGTKQISDATNSLSNSSTTQAASLEEISSSLNQLSSQTRTNAAGILPMIRL
jgi:methyl-accepting chemotaxis protein